MNGNNSIAMPQQIIFNQRLIDITFFPVMEHHAPSVKKNVALMLKPATGICNVMA